MFSWCALHENNLHKLMATLCWLFSLSNGENLLGMFSSRSTGACKSFHTNFREHLRPETIVAARFFQDDTAQEPWESPPKATFFLVVDNFFKSTTSENVHI